MHGLTQGAPLIAALFITFLSLKTPCSFMLIYAVLNTYRIQNMLNGDSVFWGEGIFMNSTKLVIPLCSLYWSIHTKDESKRGSAFAFIIGVN